MPPAVESLSPVPPSAGLAPTIRSPVTRVDLDRVVPPVDLAGVFDAAGRITLNVEEATLEEVLLVLSAATDRSLRLDEGISRRVSASYDDLPLHQVLADLLASEQLAARLEGEAVKIGLPSLSTAAFHLSFSGDAGFGGQPSSATGETATTTPVPWRAIESAVALELSERGESRLDPDGMMLFIRDHPERIDAAERILLEALAPRRRQVLIEALLMEVEPVEPISAPPSRQDHDASSRGELVTLLLENGQISRAIDALRERGPVQLLSAPRVRTLNRIPARISLARQVPLNSAGYPRTGGSSASAAAGQFVQTGITLEITPVIAANGEIVLDLRSRITTMGAPAMAETQPPLVPVQETRELQASVRAAPGQPIVLGGLLLDRASSPSATPRELVMVITATPTPWPGEEQARARPPGSEGSAPAMPDPDQD